MTFDKNIVSIADYKLFRFSHVRYRRADFWHPNMAVKPFMPAEMSGRQAAEMYSDRYLETKITLAEYDRWSDLLHGSQPGLLEVYYQEMVRKYIPNWHILGLLIYLYDRNKKNGEEKV